MVSRPVAYSSTMTALGGGLSRENPSKGNAGVTFEALKFWILVLSPGFLAVVGKVLSGETGRARVLIETGRPHAAPFFVRKTAIDPKKK